MKIYQLKVFHNKDKLLQILSKFLSKESRRQGHVVRHFKDHIFPKHKSEMNHLPPFSNDAVVTILGYRQCDQIWRFIGLWATFQSHWQQLIRPNLSHS